jgi:hypothetical protein
MGVQCSDDLPAISAIFLVPGCCGTISAGFGALQVQLMNN